MAFATPLLKHNYSIFSNSSHSASARRSTKNSNSLSQLSANSDCLADHKPSSRFYTNPKSIKSSLTRSVSGQSSISSDSSNLPQQQPKTESESLSIQVTNNHPGLISSRRTVCHTYDGSRSPRRSSLRQSPKTSKCSMLSCSQTPSFEIDENNVIDRSPLLSPHFQSQNSKELQFFCDVIPEFNNGKDSETGNCAETETGTNQTENGSHPKCASPGPLTSSASEERKSSDEASNHSTCSCHAASCGTPELSPHMLKRVTFAQYAEKFTFEFPEESDRFRRRNSSLPNLKSIPPANNSSKPVKSRRLQQQQCQHTTRAPLTSRNLGNRPQWLSDLQNEESQLDRKRRHTFNWAMLRTFRSRNRN